MTPIKIKRRETDTYALNQADMLRVSIASGEIISDNRGNFFGIHAPKKGEHQSGFSKD